MTIKYGKKKKKGLFIGIVCAILLHAGVIFFGGLLFAPSHKKDYGTLQQVELLDDTVVAEKEKPKELTEQTEEIKTETEQVPDAAEIVRNVECFPSGEVGQLGRLR